MKKIFKNKFLVLASFIGLIFLNGQVQCSALMNSNSEQNHQQEAMPKGIVHTVNGHLAAESNMVGASYGKDSLESGGEKSWYLTLHFTFKGEDENSAKAKLDIFNGREIKSLRAKVVPKQGYVFEPLWVGVPTKLLNFNDCFMIEFKILDERGLLPKNEDSCKLEFYDDNNGEFLGTLENFGDFLKSGRKSIQRVYESHAEDGSPITFRKYINPLSTKK